jgi:hypothetical protein
MIWFAASRMGETLSEMSTRRPSFVTRTVSKWSTDSPRAMRARIAVSSSWRSGGISIVTGWPTASSAV